MARKSSILLDSLWLGRYSTCSRIIAYIAGWSSLVARRAHNPKVVGSNPAPATNISSPARESGWGIFLRLVSLPCVRSTQGKKPPALRVDDTDAMQQNSFPSRMVIVQVAGREGKENTMAQKANSLAHTKWMCTYHIVFCPKYRQKAIYNQYREDLGQIFRQLCQ